MLCCSFPASTPRSPKKASRSSDCSGVVVHLGALSDGSACATSVDRYYKVHPLTERRVEVERRDSDGAARCAAHFFEEALQRRARFA